MAFPNHESKHDAESVVTPDHAYNDDRAPARGDRPDAVVFCYSRRLMDWYTDAYEGAFVGNYYGDLYVFDDTDRTVGVLGDFGIGAPTAAMLLEELAADGVDAVLSVGLAGCLDRSVEMGEFVVPDRAIRDEGTSHHYAESETYARPSEDLTGTVTRVLRDRGDPFHVGPSWTTDAIYRETGVEVERYAAEGVLTVEMEAAAVFVVAVQRGVDAAATFVVSDYLGPDDWDPRFHLTDDDLQRLGETAKDVLTSHVA